MNKLHISQSAYSKLEKRKKVNSKTPEQVKIIFKCADAEIEAIQKLLLSPAK
jgi:hypothetical protein